MSETKERPILFSAPMVRALLSGAKTQTRRVVKFRHGDFVSRPDGVMWLFRRIKGPFGAPAGRPMVCPYGQPGDRLWVRETYALSHAWDKSRVGEMPCARGDAVPVYYRADGDNERRGRWRSSIHMPRWASRLTLEITGVRVERVQDISEEDARAEGVKMPDGIPHPPEGWSYRQEFAHLWRDINGAESWAANPWVWVVEFRRVA